MAAAGRKKAAAKAKAKAKRKTATKAKTKAKAKAKARPKVKARPKAKARAKVKARTKAKARSKPKARTKVKAKAKAKLKVRAKRRVKAAPKARARVRPKAKAKAKVIAPARRPAAPPAPPPPARPRGKTILFFPEAAFGPALNCVGIAQRLRAMGHNPVFVCDRGFKGVFEKYGFEENLVDMSGGMSDAEVAKFWADFIAGHLPHFHLSPIEQLSTYVIPVWEAIVDSAILAEDGLNAHLRRLKPDVICVDNVILFPAIKRAGAPWIRIISCSENEIPDPDIPPHLSGCGEDDKACFAAFEREFLRLVKPCHDRFNAFLAKVGERPYPLGQFFETSPAMNLLLYPKPLQFRRRQPLDPRRFQYLEGCVRDEGTYQVPAFAANEGKPLVYVSFGSLGAADVDLYKRMIALFARLPCRFLMNVGDYKDQYTAVPPNVILDSWFPQPAVLPHVDLFIHHGGNNSFNEALYFGKPALVMPFCWDGLDNAQRIQDTGYGEKLARYAWTDNQLDFAIARLLSDAAMHARLRQLSHRMQQAKGVHKAADIIAQVAAKVGA